MVLRPAAIICAVMLAFWCVLALALCPGCGRPPPSMPAIDDEDAPKLWSWPASAYPLPVTISSAVPCHEIVIGSLAWWEVRTGRDLFGQVRVVAPDGPEFMGEPTPGVLVKRLVGGAPWVLGVAVPVWQGKSNREVFAVDVRLARCDAQTARHELGHALGLGHSQSLSSIMYIASDGGDGTSDSELGIVRCEAPLLSP